jgi:glycosyltransferase 2 family protein
MRMPDVTSFIARSVQGAAQAAVPGTASVRNGWGRIGIAISVLVVIAAGIVLYHILRDIEWGLVGRAIRATSAGDIALAACFVGAGYVTLTFYDFFSLRTIGRHHVPYRIAAMASFTSYSIGHNLGATVFTASAVRWRIYSAWDLSLIDVAKMAFVTGLTFWLGNVVVLGLCMLFVPEAAGAVDQLPPLANQALGAFGLAVIAGYVLWLSRGERVIGRGSWAIVLPNAPLTLLQIGIGVLDLGVGGLAIYMLLPAEPAVDFITVLVIYVTATLLGFLSHAPGSLGVFEAAVLIALPQYSKEELVAALLIFRCLYFVLPLMFAVSLLAIREMWLASAR